MKRALTGLMGPAAIVAATLAGAPVAGADDCCEHEFDWATPYFEALENHGLGYLLNDQGIPVALAAEDVCQGASARYIAQEYDEQLTLAHAEKIADAVYDDVCPEMAQ
jgi:hypothetical protein